MNIDIANQWADALESGNYQQGSGQLRSMTDRYCCLGVLCDISGLAEWTKAHERTVPEWRYMEWNGILPSAVMEWAGINSPTGNPILDHETGTDAITLNDGTEAQRGQTFPEIAALIRRYAQEI